MPYYCQVPGCIGDHVSKYLFCDAPEKILFLDIDGVLNSRESYEKGRTKSALNKPLDWVAVKQLQRIIDATQCLIVLSSTWRLGKDALNHVKGLLVEAGARTPVPLIDRTPDLSVAENGIYVARIRGDEVKAWVDQHKPLRYVCLDDDRDFHPDQPLVNTDHEHGLTEAKASECIRLLNAVPRVFGER